MTHPPSPAETAFRPHDQAARPRILARFERDAKGTTAVEFGLVALPFFALIGALIQFAFVHIWAEQNLDYRLQQAVRGLYTGSFQNANTAVTNQATLLANLKTAMCQANGTAIVTVFKCSDVKLNVAVASSFSNGAAGSPYNASTKTWNSNFEGYASAQPCQIVVVTAAVTVPVYFKLLNLGVASMSDGSHMLMSTAVFRTEPYQTSGNPTPAC